jgi:hypothetical protein
MTAPWIDEHGGEAVLGASCLQWRGQVAEIPDGSGEIDLEAVTGNRFVGRTAVNDDSPRRRRRRSRTTSSRWRARGVM